MTTLVTVTFNRVFITDPSNPTGPIVTAGSSGAIGSLSNRTISETLDGEFRQYASGRIAWKGANTALGHIATNPVLRALTDAQVNQLRKWRGRTVLFRDARGGRVFGVYPGIELLHLSHSIINDVALIGFANVTYPEIV